MDTLYPVILPVPEKYRILRGRDKVLSLSRHARRALEISADRSGIRLGSLAKDKNGAPVPCAGHFWSLTHKTGFVGAVVADGPIGIDLEEIRPCNKALFAKIADDDEWALSGTHSFTLFFRFWTSKEAVLKTGGMGLTDLSKCRISEIIDDRNIVVRYRNAAWHVQHFYFSGHIASVVKHSIHVKWSLLDESIDHHPD